MIETLRICLLCYRGDMRCGGQGVYLWHLARELARRGHQIDVLVGPPTPDPMPFCRRVDAIWNDQFWGKWFLGGRDACPLPQDRPWAVLSPLRFYELAASWIGFFPEPMGFSVRAFRELAYRLRSGRYDIVHDVQSLGWGLLGIRTLGLPVLSTVHHPLSVDRRASLQRDHTLREKLGSLEFHPIGMQAAVARRLDAILTSSQVSRSLLNRDFGVPEERIHTLGNGVDTDLYRPDASPQRDPNSLLSVARARDPNKGVATLLRALARLPRELHLTLVDNDDATNPARHWAKQLGVVERLTITGPLPPAALVDAYRRATLVVVPSRFEGFGLPAVEALACGTPVIATAAGSLPEIMGSILGATAGEFPGHAGSGYAIPPDEPEALARGIAALLADPGARQRMGQRARPQIEARFSWPGIAARTEAVYRELLAARGRPRRRITSAQLGADRANTSNPQSNAHPSRRGRRRTTRLQGGKPQPREAPQIPSISIQRPACSRSSARS